MGPRARYLGSDAPKETFIWQDPVPTADYEMINETDIAELKTNILDSGLSVPQLVRTAWASASSYRDTDMRGGANGARIRLAPQKDWPANNPTELEKVLSTLEGIQKAFNDNSDKNSLFGAFTGDTSNKQVSLADLIVLGGAAAIEKAAKDVGYEVTVPFTAGRVDATQAYTDANSFAVLEPMADGFRNYYNTKSAMSPAEMLIDKASTLSLTVPEMTVLVGGMRALNANADGSSYGVFTEQPGALSNHFFVNLLDMSTKWKKSSKADGLYEGVDRKTGQSKWEATPVDLIFGSNTELRAVAEVYASDDAKEKFVNDFVKAWIKVMTLDRFDIAAK